MAESSQDLLQAATGEGYDPDQTWPDEPLDLPEDEGDIEADATPVVES